MSTGDSQQLRLTLKVLAAVFVVLASAWALELLVLRTPVLTPFGTREALTPLYSFFIPTARWAAILFPLLLIALVRLAPRLGDEERSSRAVFGVALSIAAVVLPLALFVVRQPVGTLGTLLTLYPGEEVYYDALRIDSLAEFWRHYPELMPQLSLHGKHFPPGHATILWIVGRFAGSGVLPVAATVMTMFVAGILFSWRALAVLVGEGAARQGALLLLVCPSLLDFSCTSTDATFFSVTALALWAAVRALATEGGRGTALLAGITLLAATLLSFSALPLGLLILLLALLSVPGDVARIVRQSIWIGAGFLIPVSLLRATVGFDLLRCFQVARHLNEQFMAAVIGASPSEVYARLAYGNLIAFLIGAGLALVSAVVLRLILHRAGLEPFAVAALATLGVMVFGGLYQLETERIWLFAMPWLAAVAVGGGSLSVAALRALMVAGGLQALAMEMLTFTLW